MLHSVKSELRLLSFATESVVFAHKSQNHRDVVESRVTGVDSQDYRHDSSALPSVLPSQAVHHVERHCLVQSDASHDQKVPPSGHFVPVGLSLKLPTGGTLGPN